MWQPFQNCGVALYPFKSVLVICIHQLATGNLLHRCSSGEFHAGYFILSLAGVSQFSLVIAVFYFARVLYLLGSFKL